MEKGRAVVEAVGDIAELHGHIGVCIRRHEDARRAVARVRRFSQPDMRLRKRPPYLGLGNGDQALAAISQATATAKIVG